MNTLYVHYDQSYSGGEYLSDELCSDREPEYIHTNFEYCSLTKREYQFDQIDTDIEFVAGDTCYLVIVNYSDGDTFGYTDGYFKICGVFKDRDTAKELSKIIYKHDEHYRNANWDDKGRYTISFQGQDIHTTWIGYFSRLNMVDIEVMEVLE